MEEFILKVLMGIMVAFLVITGIYSIYAMVLAVIMGDKSIIEALIMISLYSVSTLLLSRVFIDEIKH